MSVLILVLCVVKLWNGDTAGTAATTQLEVHSIKLELCNYNYVIRYNYVMQPIYVTSTAMVCMLGC